MFQFMTNRVRHDFKLPIKKDRQGQKHLYLIELLTPVYCQTKQGRSLLKAYDVILGQALEGLTIESINQDPLLIREYHLTLDVPGPLTEYTVGDNAIIHDLMNDEKPGQAFVVFSNLGDKLCHAYLDALAILRQRESSDSFLSFQEQKLIGLLFTELLRDHDLKISKSQSQFPDKAVKYATRDTQAGIIMTYVREHIYDITLKEVAAHFAYQPNYFSRLCHNLYGVSFNDLKTQIKLEIAKEQLAMTTKGLEEISQELGYKAVSNFHRNFKAQTGLTPREYRQDHQIGL